MCLTLYPGSTQTCSFDVPYIADTLSKGVVTFRQDDQTRLKVETTNIVSNQDDPNKSTISITLTQSQSLKLKNSVQCSVQLNLLTTTGARLMCKPIMVNVEEQHYQLPVV